MTVHHGTPASGVKAKLCPADRRTHGRRRLAFAVAATLALSGPAVAQSSVNPSSDWNANYGFASTADRSLRLLQSDLIRKGEGDYYDKLSDTYNVTNNVSNTTEIGQQTTTIGAVNTATNEIDISGDGVNLDLTNSSSNTGCQNGAITIDSAGSPSATRRCR